VNYALVGFGRMGRAVDAAAAARGHRRVALVPAPLGRPLEPADLGGADVAFEFTRAAAAEANLVALLQAGVGVVCGTTGWEPGPGLARAVAGARTGLVLAPNFSVGVNLFFRLVAVAADLFADSGLCEPFVAEVHHRDKRDAPSGTALRLAALLEAGGGGRREVPVSALRAGHEPGRHTVGFDGPHELVTLCHAARGRAGFAAGAVLAAEWIAGRRGRHDFDPVLDDLLAARAAEEPR
jgi:4-hydroxy-tetrahydrodipicolinate reductase